MNTKETYGQSSNLDALITELHTLSTKYQSLLERESVSGDVQCLQNWITSYKQGRLEAGEAIHEYGYDLLSNIKRKLKSAERELQRMDAESPNAKNFNGRKAHRLSQAAALTGDMQEMIKEVTDEEINA